MIVEGHRQGFGLTQTRQNALGVERWQECRAQGQPEVDRLLVRLALRRQMRQGMQRLVEIPHSLMVRRARHGSFPGLSEICQSFIPDFTP